MLLSSHILSRGRDGGRPGQHRAGRADRRLRHPRRPAPPHPHQRRRDPPRPVPQTEAAPWPGVDAAATGPRAPVLSVETSAVGDVLHRLGATASRPSPASRPRSRSSSSRSTATRSGTDEAAATRRRCRHDAHFAGTGAAPAAGLAARPLDHRSPACSPSWPPPTGRWSATLDLYPTDAEAASGAAVMATTRRSPPSTARSPPPPPRASACSRPS